MSDTIRVRFHFGTRWVGASTDETVEYDREEWESMTEQEREEAALTWAANQGLDVGYSVEDE